MATNSIWWKIGSVSAALAVGFGAFGAHALRDRIQDQRILAAFNTGAQYHLIHSFALLACAFAHKPHATAAGSLFASGITLFSGSLYVMGVTEDRRWGMVTPVGGLSFMAGWMVLAFAKLRFGAKVI